MEYHEEMKRKIIIILTVLNYILSDDTSILYKGVTYLDALGVHVLVEPDLTRGWRVGTHPGYGLPLLEDRPGHQVRVATCWCAPGFPPSWGRGDCCQEGEADQNLNITKTSQFTSSIFLRQLIQWLIPTYILTNWLIPTYTLITWYTMIWMHIY